MRLHIPRMDSEWFKKRMKEKGVTQETLGNKLGRDRDLIRRIFSGTQPMRLDEALVFAETLQVSYREVVEHALNLKAGGLLFADAGATVPLRYRIAAVDASGGTFDLGEDCPRLSPPPKWHATPNAFAAEVADQSFDRRYPVGAVLYCIPPDEAGRALRAGDAVVVLHRANGRVFEARGGIVTAVPGRGGFVVIGASFDPKYALSIWFEREGAGAFLQEQASRFKEMAPEPIDFVYEPQPLDAGVIVGIVTAAFRPEV